MGKDSGQCQCGSYSFYKETVVFYAKNGSIVESSSLSRLACVRCGSSRVVEVGLKDGIPFRREHNGPDGVNKVREDEKEYRTLELSE